VTTPTGEIDGQIVNLRPAMNWEGGFTEGIWWSIQDMLFQTSWENYRKAWKDPLKRRNVLIALEELLIIMLILALISAFVASQGVDEVRDLDNNLQ